MFKQGLNAVDIKNLKKMRDAEVPEKEIAKSLGVDPKLLKTEFTPAKVAAADAKMAASRGALNAAAGKAMSAPVPPLNPKASNKESAKK